MFSIDRKVPPLSASALEVEHVRVYIGEGLHSVKPLNTTGKWRLKRSLNGTISMEVQHQGLIFKSWVDESEIVYYCLEKIIHLGEC